MAEPDPQAHRLLGWVSLDPAADNNRQNAAVKWLLATWKTKWGKVWLSLAGFIIVAAIANTGRGPSGVGEGNTTPTTPSTVGQSESSRVVVDYAQEKIRNAIGRYANYSCATLDSNIAFSGSDSTGAVYVAGCGDWLYLVTFDRHQQISVDRISPHRDAGSPYVDADEVLREAVRIAQHRWNGR